MRNSFLIGFTTLSVVAIATTLPAQPATQQPPAAEARPTAGASPLRVDLPAEVQAVLDKRYPENVDDLRTLEGQVKRVLQAGRKATVAVTLGGAAGSGVIVSPDGIVLTAGHVVGEPGRRVTFYFADGKRARGVSLGMNESIDSGMMRITDPGPWPYAELAEADSTKIGDWVLAIGQPNGFFKDRAPPVRLGRVLYQSDEVINTDCTLVGGDSGGPLFNLRGQVIGIHSRIGPRLTANMHVPISTYHVTWDRLADSEAWGGRRRRGGREMPAEGRPLLGVAGNPEGVDCTITQVFPGLPAARAGVKVGDVVQKFDDAEVASFADLSRLVLTKRPRDKVKLRLVRDGEELEIEIALAGVTGDFPGAPSPSDEKE
ncbi:S1C family serine protease [Pirellulimonas nuda]|uniref:S1C family serine protease n=1 Tax=Pirellulimonas nuda TaxID=2528009 RepID=UPI0018D2F58B|nr:trypsin-like peptidase domain-containing protein [Pirellulimonas nuda]